jgi:SAM-dependent methyltransferase
VSLGENLLYAVTKRLSNRNLGQSQEMTQALTNANSYAEYRLDCLNKVLNAARTYNVAWQNKDVLDLGCYDGAISQGYLDSGAWSVIGVDIDEPAVLNAQQRFTDERLQFRVSGPEGLPLDDACVDTIFSYDVFEHVAYPAEILSECHRVLRPGGKLLIGTWGWYHPFAPHLWSTMPLPWAHVLFSERTMLRTCRRVYNSDWYTPNMHDFDKNGEKIAEKYTHEEIPKNYLNKFLIRDFERVFRDSPLKYKIHPQRFCSRWAAWTTRFLSVPLLKEFLTAYIWVVLERPAMVAKSNRDRIAALVTA